MPATDYLGSATPLASLGRSILSSRRDAMDDTSGAGYAQELDAFQRHVAKVFAGLSSPGDDLLSLCWVRKIVDAFLACFHEFRTILFDGDGKKIASTPPLDRMVAEFFERGVRALDVCNAVRDGVEQLRQWRRHLDIVLAALGDPRAPFAKGRLLRARKALADLALATLDDNRGDNTAVFSRRNRSFGKDGRHRRSHSCGGGTGHFRSRSWSVSQSWSAARQLQAMASGLAAPRGHEVVATRGLAVTVYAMSSVLFFVMWALVAAIPCQDRGLHTNFSIPRSFPWAASILSLHERILEESKKKERKNSSGLLKEIHHLERSTHRLIELIDNAQYPIMMEKEAEIREVVQELVEVRGALKDGLDSMELLVREVFHRIVQNRVDGLNCLGKSSLS